MNRRLVLIAATLTIVGAAAGSAAADSNHGHKRNEVCLVLAQDDNGNSTKDFCITWPEAAPHPGV